MFFWDTVYIHFLFSKKTREGLCLLVLLILYTVTCTELKGRHWLCLFQFLATCARLSRILSFRVHVKLFYRVVSYRILA